MKEHEHSAKRQPETKPTEDEVAKKAYAIYLKEGRPQGHADENWSEAEAQLQHTGSGHPAEHDHHDHHAHMAADFRKRFWISLVLTLPILVLSPMLQSLVGLREAIREDIDMSFGCTPDFTRRSVGYVGCSDGWQDLMDNFKMDWEFEQAEDGNIALMGEIDLSDGMEFTLGVGFGRTEHSASAHLLQAFATPFADQREKFVSQWQRTRAEVDLSAHTKDGGSLMRLSQCLLLAHEDKFSAHLEEWMVTNRGELVKGKPRHYVRITPADPKQNAASPDPDQAEIVLANGHSPAKSAHSVRPDPYQDTFGATVSIRSRGISGGVDKSDMSDCWRVPT